MNRVSALSALMLSALAAATGCAHNEPPRRAAAGKPSVRGEGAASAPALGPIEEPDEASGDPDCAAGAFKLGRLDTTMPFDYLELPDLSRRGVILRFGALCAPERPGMGETQKQQNCQLRFERQRARHFALWQRMKEPAAKGLAVLAVGGSVRSFATEQKLRTFLGRVNTPTEAFFWATYHRYRPKCGEDELTVERTPDGYLLSAEAGDGCASDITGHRILVTPDAEVISLSERLIKPHTPSCALGRLPAASLAARHAVPSGAELSSGCEIGAFAAGAAYLEAAAVFAFRELAEELRALGAPERLVAQAAVGIDDEMRHARIMSAIAKARGVQVETPQPMLVARRDAFTLALDNAAEGCVRESYGALLAMHQQRFARDPVLQAAAAVIAPDELRHAAFSWELHAWLWPRLTGAQQAQVRAHMQATTDAFEASLEEPSDTLRHRAGLPSRPVALKLMGQLRRTLWS